MERRKPGENAESDPERGIDTVPRLPDWSARIDTFSVAWGTKGESGTGHQRTVTDGGIALRIGVARRFGIPRQKAWVKAMCGESKESREDAQPSSVRLMGTNTRLGD